MLCYVNKDNFLTYLSNYKSQLLFVKLVSISSSWVIKQLFQIFLCNSQNYHPLGAVDDSMNCCLRPRATVHRVIHSTEGVIVLTVAQKGMK